MANDFIKAMNQGNFPYWNYPFAYGWMTHQIRTYLRGECSREAFTAAFAHMDMVHEHWVAIISEAPSVEAARRLFQKAYMISDG